MADIKLNDTVSINFDQGLEMVKMEVDKTLSTSPSVIREYTSHLANSVGKYIRSASVLTCAMDEQNKIHPNAIKWAAAIEILHLATLVHDDVIDNADLRRGQISLQKKYGKRTAVICGDYLLTVALSLAASVENKEDYLKLKMPDFISRVCLGELYQHINSGNYSLTVYRYLKIISGKTAALFEASFYAGAVLSTSDEMVWKQLAKLGRYIGMVFQLTDDCMDFETTEKIAKKPVQSDYEQNVITLPLIHAFKTIKELKQKADTQGLTRADINQAVNISGGINYTRMVAKKYYNKAHIIIDKLDVTEYKRERLLELLHKSYRVFN